MMSNANLCGSAFLHLASLLYLGEVSSASDLTGWLMTTAVVPVSVGIVRLAVALRSLAGKLDSDHPEELLDDSTSVEAVVSE